MADTQEKILGLLRHEPKYTNKEMADKLGIPDRTFARRIADMKKEGLI